MEIRHRLVTFAKLTNLPRLYRGLSYTLNMKKKNNNIKNELQMELRAPDTGVERGSA